jgi:hypothetical protein
MTFFFPVAAAADVSLWPCSPSNWANMRRKRAGTRIGLPGGPNAEGEAGGSIDDVEDSVGSADEVREDG